jgi:hypothetical protein
MILKIEINNEPDYEFGVSLEGRAYRMRITLNEREGTWKLDVFDVDGNELAGGVQIVANYPLLNRFADERLPPGTLVLWDSTGKNREATPDTMGTEHFLLYEESA